MDAFHVPHFRLGRKRNVIEVEDDTRANEELEEIVLEPNVPCPIERRIYEAGRFYTHEEYRIMDKERSNNASGMRHTIAIVKSIIKEVS